MLYNKQEYKLVKLDHATTEEIFGKIGNDQRFVNIASLYSVSTFAHAEETCRIMKHLNPKARIVMDSTVCVGGNTGSMCDHFDRVVGTELDENNYTLANYNLSSKKNITLLNQSCLDYLINDTKEFFDIIIFDPPWNIDHAEVIDHSTIGIPGVSMKDSIFVMLNFTDYLIIKTSRNDSVIFYKEYLSETRFDVLEIDISNYKLILIAPLGDNGLDFSNYVIPKLFSFNYKKILKKNEQLLSD